MAFTHNFPFDPTYGYAEQRLRIIKAPVVDPRRTRELLERVGLSATPCQRRVRRLEEAGVITRYAALVAPAALGLRLQALVQVTLDDHSEAVVAAFEAEIRARPEVVACYAVTGDMDFLLHVQATDLALVVTQRLREIDTVDFRADDVRRWHDLHENSSMA